MSAVRGSPKPPPVRITLTLPAINTAEEVWLLAAGAGKASAVGMALAGGRAGAGAGRRGARRRPHAAGCWTGPAASRGPPPEAPQPAADRTPPRRREPRPLLLAALGVQACSASARIAAPSASVRRSFTYARWVLYGSVRGARRRVLLVLAGRAGRNAGSPSRGGGASAANDGSRAWPLAHQ